MNAVLTWHTSVTADPLQEKGCGDRCETALYIRVSTQEQATEGINLNVREQRCRQVAEAAGHADIDLYCDDGYSGTITNRPGLQQLLAALPEYDAVCIWKLDRLTRSIRGWADTMAQFRDAHCGLASATEAFDFSSAAGRMHIGMLALVGEFYVELLRENTTAALRMCFEQGYHHGFPPLGYAYPTDENGELIRRQVLEIVPEET
jgi:site-specific DNA recombinase